MKRSVWLLLLPAWLGCEAITDFDRDRIETMTVPPTVLPPALDAGRRDAGSDAEPPDSELDGELPERDGEADDATLDAATALDGGAEDAEAAVDARAPEDAGPEPTDAGPVAAMDGGADAGSEMDAALEAGAMDAQTADAGMDAAEVDAEAGAADAGADAHTGDAASDAALDASDATSDAAAAQDAAGAD